LSFILMQLMAAYLVLVEPLLRANIYRNFKKQLPVDPHARLLYYRTQVLWELSWLVVLVLIVIPIPDPLNYLGLTLPNQVGWIISFALLGGIVLSVSLIRRNPNALENMRHSLETSAAVLPSTPAERKWFTIATITAGICEELLYRGFFLRYLRTVLPGWNWIVLALLSGIVYGLSRAYQGRKGILTTTLAGFSYAVIYILGGSLLPAMAFHILADLRTLFFWQPKEDKKKSR
ncbi:MAG: CPBP family intramembrane metalloprotease, partial [Anaerolineae bacterium]|nr:CPBP family intramembrane metalloprotease [Anaerolineae bacterium]